MECFFWCLPWAQLLAWRTGSINPCCVVPLDEEVSASPEVRCTPLLATSAVRAENETHGLLRVPCPLLALLVLVFQPKRPHKEHFLSHCVPGHCAVSTWGGSLAACLSVGEKCKNSKYTSCCPCGRGGTLQTAPKRPREFCEQRCHPSGSWQVRGWF